MRINQTAIIPKIARIASIVIVVAGIFSIPLFAYAERDASFNPLELNFGPIDVGETETLQVTITNSGTGQNLVGRFGVWFLGNIRLDTPPFYCVGGDCPSPQFNIPPGNSETFDIEYRPADPGAHSIVWSLLDGNVGRWPATENATLDPRYIPRCADIGWSGPGGTCNTGSVCRNFHQPCPDDFNCEQTSLPVKDVYLCTPEFSFQLKGNANDVPVATCILGGTTPHTYGAEGTCVTELANLTNYRVCAGDAGGEIASSAWQGPCVPPSGWKCVDEFGFGNYTFHSIDSCTPAADPPILEVFPTNHDFMDVEAGSGPYIQPFSVTNTGGGTLTGSVSGLAAPYSCWSANCTGYSVPAGDTHLVEIAFDPGIAGGPWPEIAVFSNDAGATEDVILSGSASVALPDPSIDDFQVSDNTIFAGDTISFTWQSSNADYCVISEDQTGTNSGNLNPDAPPAAPYEDTPGSTALWTYELICYKGANASVPQTVVVDVSAPPNAPDPDLKVDGVDVPPVISQNTTIDLTWSVTQDPGNVTCQADGTAGWTGAGLPANQGTPVAFDTTGLTPGNSFSLILTCTNSLTSDVNSDIVNITIADDISVVTPLTVTSVVDYDNQAAIAWEVTNPTGSVECEWRDPALGNSALYSHNENITSPQLTNNATISLYCRDGVGGPFTMIDGPKTAYVRPRVNVTVSNQYPEYDIDTINVDWTVEGPAANCAGQLYAPWNTPKAVAGGPEVVGPFTSDASFGLQCENSSNPAVTGSDPTPPSIQVAPHIYSFDSDDESVIQGGSTRLFWSVGGVGHVCEGDLLSGTSDSGWTGVGKETGTEHVLNNITDTTTYTLECTRPGVPSPGPATAPVTVDEPQTSITADRRQVLVGRDVEIIWSAINVQAIRILKQDLVAGGPAVDITAAAMGTTYPDDGDDMVTYDLQNQTFTENVSGDTRYILEVDTLTGSQQIPLDVFTLEPTFQEE